MNSKSSTKQRHSKYGGGGWRVDAGRPRPGTVLDEVFYFQHNSNGPRNIRILARNEVTDTVKKQHKHIYTFTKRSASTEPLGASQRDPHGGTTNGQLPPLDRIMAGKEVMNPQDCTPEVLAGMQRLPDNFNKTLDLMLGISRSLSPSVKFQGKRRKNSIMLEQMNAVADNEPPSEVRFVSWPKSNFEESEWMRMVKKYRYVSKRRHKEAALALAAQDAFSSEAAEMTRSGTIEHAGLDLSVIPRQWLHKGMTKISLLACGLQSLPSQLGLLVPNLTTLLLAHNHLTDLPPTLGMLDQLLDLGLTTNHFAIFPEVICDLKSLESLSLHNNKISRIPASISCCQMLNAFYMTHNPVERLPLTIGLLKRLTMLTFDRTPRDSTMPQIEHHLPDWASEAPATVMRDHYHLLLKNKIIHIKQALQANFLRARAAFQHLDLDKSGDLDEYEMKAALEKLKCDVHNFEEVWAWLDVNHSGAIDYQEFMQSAMTNMFEAHEEPDAALRKAMAQEIEAQEQEKERRAKQEGEEQKLMLKLSQTLGHVQQI